MISCDQHDYIEIACMYHFQLTLTLKNGKQITGQASDTLYNKNKQQCIRVLHNEGHTDVVINQLSKMRAHNKNRYFDVIDFNEIVCQLDP